MEDITLTQNNETSQEVSAQPENPTDEIDAARRNYVSTWVKKIKSAHTFWKDKKLYEEIKENQQFAARGCDKAWYDAKNYTVPILNRHINQSVATLYAKNPTVVASRRERLLYKLWDGRADSLQSAMEFAAAGDPQSMAVIQEVLAVRQQNLMMDRMGKTLEILWDYYVGEQDCNFKQQLKAAVRRAKVCKVGYIKLGFQRVLEKNPEITAQIADVTSKIARMESTLYKMTKDELDDDAPELEELQQNLKDLQNQETMVVREGPVFDFPRANEIIVDPACRHLKSFAGAGWIAHWFDMSPDLVYETYEVDLKTYGYTKYKDTGDVYKDAEKYDGETKARIYEVYDKVNRQCFAVCDGYPDYIEEPYGQKLKIERFYPVFPIVFNEVENDDNIYPPSDVEQGRHIQNEYNRSREALREHRIAARPYYVVAAAVEEHEKKKIANHAAHEMIVIAGLEVGQKVEEFIQRGPVENIDPNLYEVEMHFSDLLRVLGTQEANLGGTSDSTATESSIAENSMGTFNASSVDDLDEVLSELVHATAQVMLTELAKETVVEIVGEGAVWPDLPVTREQVSKDLSLKIRAGSSGRPNQAAELAKFERGTPLLIQIPGINPTPLGRKLGELLEIDVDELIAENLPSIQAINAIVAKAGAGAPGGQSTGNADSDPNQQGGKGANNTPGAGQNENEQGAQPAYPDPMSIV